MEHWPEVEVAAQGYEALCQRCGRREQVALFYRSRAFAATLAALLDGSAWPADTKRPPTWGRCATCGGPYECSVFGYPEELQ